MSSEIPVCTESLEGFPERSCIPGADVNCETVCCFPVYKALWCGWSTDAQPSNKECTWTVSAPRSGCLAVHSGWALPLWQWGLRGGFFHILTLSLGNSFHMTAHQSLGPQNTFYICWLGQSLWSFGQRSELRGLSFGDVCLPFLDRRVCHVHVIQDPRSQCLKGGPPCSITRPSCADVLLILE